MEFLKRHYEKLILAVLLLAFIGSMFYLMVIIRSSAEITKETLQLPTRAPDFTVIDAKDPKFNAGALMQIGTAWASSTPRNPKFKNFSSDLVVTFGVGRCAHCSHLIPFYFFQNRNCPFCNGELKEPPLVPTLSSFKTIPDDVKTANGIPLNDPGAVLDDYDGDGFSNLHEFINNTAMLDAKSRPPLWHRLVVGGVDRVKLPFMLMKINTKGSTEMAQWDIQVNDLGKGRSVFLTHNDIIKIDDSDYQVVNIKIDHKERKVGGDTVTDDHSVIYLQQLGGDRKIEMQVGKDVYSPEPKVIIYDLGEPNRFFQLDVGREFTMGNRTSGTAKFRVKSIDQKEGTVILIQRSGRETGKELPEAITRAGKIPLDERIRPQGFGGRSNPDGMGM